MQRAGQTLPCQASSRPSCLPTRPSLNRRCNTKPIPRWDVHFGEIDDDSKHSTAPHITFRPQLGGHR